MWRARLCVTELRGVVWPCCNEADKLKAVGIETDRKMAKSSKLVALKRGRILLVRRRRDQLWMFPGGQKRAQESEKDCLRREIKEELPNLKLGRRIKLWKESKRRTAIPVEKWMTRSSSRAKYPAT